MGLLGTHKKENGEEFYLYVLRRRLKMIKLKELLAEAKKAKLGDYTHYRKQLVTGLKATGNDHLKDLLDALGSYSFDVGDVYMDGKDLVYVDDTIGKWKGKSYWWLLNLLQKKKIIRKY
jgi:hypothetical protein